MELCPADVQDMVYQTIGDVREEYERLKQKIPSWVSNQMSVRGGPVPMDIGNVDWVRLRGRVGGGCERKPFAALQLRWLEARLPRVPVRQKQSGKARDWTRERAREAETSGQKGNARGTSACYTCGKVGHKAWECWARNVNAVQEESDERDAGTCV